MAVLLSLRCFPLKFVVVLVPLLSPLSFAHPAAAGETAGDVTTRVRQEVVTTDGGKSTTHNPSSDSEETHIDGGSPTRDGSPRRSSSIILPESEAPTCASTSITGCCKLVRRTLPRARSSAMIRKKMSEKTVATIVEKTGKEWAPRYLAQCLLGDSRGRALVFWVVRHRWVVIGCLLLGVIFHETPYDSPLPIGPKIGSFLIL